MGSIGSPPNDAYKDCAQGICNFYCPQLCNYYYYPPPDIIDDDDSGGPTFSPLIIAIIGILSSAFLLVSYYAIITKYCRRRREQQQTRDSSNLVTDEMSLNQWQAVGGLDENLIDSITVFKYKKGEKLIEGTDCSVCLNEFEENENLRLMPKCCHAFHPSCIDVWLKSHSNCPLCRANAAPIYPAPAPAPITTSSGAVNISALQIQQQNDLVFVVEERERERETSPAHQVFVKSPLGGNGSVGNSDQEEVRQLRRSISFSVADILRIDEDDEGLRIQIRETDTGTGCSSEEGVGREERKLNNTAAVKRSFSTGRFNFYKAS